LKPLSSPTRQRTTLIWRNWCIFESWIRLTAMPGALLHWYSIRAYYSKVLKKNYAVIFCILYKSLLQKFNFF
jgi:hypothetical protein